MTKLACRYGIDAARPEVGIIVESAADDQVLDMTGRPDCLYLELPGPHEQWGRYGPALRLMGDPPRSHHKSNAELDAEGFEKAHPLREIAGLPVRSDNRRLETDMRPWRAPDLTPDVARAAKRLEMGLAFHAAAASFDSAALGGEPRRYPSDADAERKLQMAALASLAGQSKAGWTATLRCAEGGSAPVGVPHTALQVHAVLADYQAFTDALHAERDAVEARIAAAGAVADILAIARA